MLSAKRIVPAISALLILLVSAACLSPNGGAASQTPTSTPLPPAVPAVEVMQTPNLPNPALQGTFQGIGTKMVLTYKCYGEGAPTILVEAGAGDRPTESMTWNAVIQGVAPTTRICVYDRVPVHTPLDAARNLHALLAAVPISGPYILVAHSLGGWYARVFVHQYRDEVVGMILVDTTTTIPEETMIYATAYPTRSPNEPDSIAKYRFSATDIYTIPSDSMDGLDMQASNGQVRQTGTFGDLPLVVIAHTPGPLDVSVFDPSIQKQIAEILVKMEASQTALSSKSVFIQARTHQHFISEYDPQIVIDAIIGMVQEIRKQDARSQENHELMNIGLITGIVIVVLSVLLLIIRKRPTTPAFPQSTP